MGGKRRDWSKVGEMVREIRSRGMKLVDGAAEFGVKPEVLYEYTRRERRGRGGLESPLKPEEDGSVREIAADEEEGAGTVPVDDKETSVGLPSELEAMIVSYRESHPDHGYKRIEEWLKRDHLVVVPRKTIRRVLKGHGLHTTNDSSFDGGQGEAHKGSRRFEAPYARSLYQMDIAYVYITGVPVLYLVVVVDDYSRFCVGAQLCDRFSGSMMIEVLHGAIDRHGKPERILTDQGPSFYTWSYEPTLFQRYLDEMKIEHLVSDPHSPQTAGKVERLIQTLRREFLEKRRFETASAAREALEQFIQEYNYGRGHQSLGGQSPSTRFHGIESETGRIEASLASREVDFSRGYLILKAGGHTVSVLQSAKGLSVYLDGHILKASGADECGGGKAA